MRSVVFLEQRRDPSIRPHTFTFTSKSTSTRSCRSPHRIPQTSIHPYRHTLLARADCWLVQPKRGPLGRRKSNHIPRECLEIASELWQMSAVPSLLDTPSPTLSRPAQAALCRRPRPIQHSKSSRGKRHARDRQSRQRAPCSRMRLPVSAWRLDYR